MDRLGTQIQSDLLPTIREKLGDKDFVRILKQYRELFDAILRLSNVCFMRTGSYTGDGSTGQAITGLGFAPKYVKVWTHPASETDMYVFEKVDQTWGDYAVLHGVTATHEHQSVDNRINSLDADGFTVDDDGSDTHPNKNEQVYDYLVLG